MILWWISWVHFITLCQHWKQQWEVKLIYSKVKNITRWFVGLLGHNSFFVTFFSHGCQIHYVTKITYALATHKQNNLHTFQQKFSQEMQLKLTNSILLLALPINWGIVMSIVNILEIVQSEQVQQNSPNSMTYIFTTQTRFRPTSSQMLTFNFQHFLEML